MERRDFEGEIVAGRRAEARRRFAELSFTHRREFAEWVGGAKKQETRDRRAAKAIEMLLIGETR